MKRRKIYYVPGMISLIFLPILCVWYLNEHKNVERCIEVNYCHKYIPEYHKKNIWWLDTTILSQTRLKRTYTTYKIDNQNTGSEILKRIENNSKELVCKNDTINGIHIILGDSCPYRCLTEIIDILKKYNKTITTTEQNIAFHKNMDLFSGIFFSL